MDRSTPRRVHIRQMPREEAHAHFFHRERAVATRYPFTEWHFEWAWQEALKRDLRVDRKTHKCRDDHFSPLIACEPVERPTETMPLEECYWWFCCEVSAIAAGAYNRGEIK